MEVIMVTEGAMEVVIVMEVGTVVDIHPVHQQRS